MEFGRTRRIGRRKTCDGAGAPHPLAVLHAWRDLGEDDVALQKPHIPSRDFLRAATGFEINRPSFFGDCSHRNERDQAVRRKVFKRCLRIDISDLFKRCPRPALRHLPRPARSVAFPPPLHAEPTLRAYLASTPRFTGGSRGTHAARRDSRSAGPSMRRASPSSVTTSPSCSSAIGPPAPLRGRRGRP